MPKTSIEWTDRSVNPIRARDKATGAEGHWCAKISPGCKNCYASRIQARLKMHAYEAGNRDKVELYLNRARFDEVLRRRIPTKWFWFDMTDPFGDWVPDAWIDESFAVMALTPHHTHQVLTKRADRMHAYFADRDARADGITSAWLDLVGPPISSHDDVVAWCRERGIPLHERMRRRDVINAGGGFDFFNRGVRDCATPSWPLPNVWLGVSVENQAQADERIPYLIGTPASVRFVSAEPLLGPVDLRHVFCLDGDALGPDLYNLGIDAGINWVVAGGESGPSARPMHPTWARELRDQCTAAGVPFFFKQWGAWAPPDDSGVRNIRLSKRTWAYESLRFQPDGTEYRANEPDSYSAPGMESVLRVGKKRAGRLLDGVEWSQFPEVSR